MKQLTQYRIDFQSGALTAATALMGFAIFLQAVYFFVLCSIFEVSTGVLVLFLIIPMVLELAWILLLHSIKLNFARFYGVFGAVICVLLTIQLYMTGSVLQIVLGTIAYLLCMGLWVLITWGYFPYKYCGSLLFAGIGCIRLLCFDMPRYFPSGDWQRFVLELASLCAIGAMMLFFPALTDQEPAQE